MTLLYLAQPIDQLATVSPQAVQVSRIAASLLESLESRSEQLSAAGGLVVYQPQRAFHVLDGTEPDLTIRRVNDHALAQADMLVAILPQGSPSVGVPTEIEQARAAGKLVLVMTDMRNSWSLCADGLVTVGLLNNVAAAEWVLEQVQADWRFKAGKGTGGVLRRVQESTEAWHEARGDHRLTVPWPHPARLDPGGLESVIRTDRLVAPNEPRASAPLTFERTDTWIQVPIPTRAHDDDAGLDLWVTEKVTIEPGQFADVSCGVRAQLPDGVWAMITGRSSTLRKRGLLVVQGIIDTGYRGELFAGVQNLSPAPVTVSVGERLAQLILFDNVTARYAPTLGEVSIGTHRGANGFGSTGQ